MLDTNRNLQYVWLGDSTIDKFTKSTYLNLAELAQKKGAKKLVLVQNRDHVDKGKNSRNSNNSYID